VSRIRPLALARRLGVDEDQMVRACLLGARDGMLLTLWDLLCPSCRVPAGIEETLRAVKEHGRCEVCNIDFALDLATSIEMVFRVHPQIRAADASTYCLSSPGKTPHVMAQVRLAAGERFLLESALPEGSYQLVGRRLPYHVSFRVRGDGETAHWELSLKDGPSAQLGRVLRVGRQDILLVNDTGREQLIRVEKTLARDDVFTAARAAGHPLFRQLFPNEVLEPGALVRVSSLVLVYADIRGGVVDEAGTGDARAFSQLYAAFKEIEAQVAAAGGSVVKLMGDGVLAVFDEPGAAVRAALKLDEAMAKVSAKITVHAAVHRGPAAAVTLNERLDYFGKSVDVVTVLAKNRAVGRVVVSDDVLADPVVQEILDERAKIRAMRLGDSGEHTGPIAIA
jgi:class 3 adenylate cyclase